MRTDPLIGGCEFILYESKLARAILLKQGAAIFNRRPNQAGDFKSPLLVAAHMPRQMTNDRTELVEFPEQNIPSSIREIRVIRGYFGCSQPMGWRERDERQRFAFDFQSRC